MKLFPLALALVAIAGCNRGVENNKEAVRQAVIDHLSGRSDLNISSMNVNVADVNFRGNEADARVSFSAKGGDASQGMSITYKLERQGSRWVVKGRTDSGQGHGQGATMPQAAPTTPPVTDLPPGHPPVGGEKKK